MVVAAVSSVPSLDGRPLPPASSGGQKRGRAEKEVERGAADFKKKEQPVDPRKMRGRARNGDVSDKLTSAVQLRMVSVMSALLTSPVRHKLGF